jgi:hypothetical protein
MNPNNVGRTNERKKKNVQYLTNEGKKNMNRKKKNGKTVAIEKDNEEKKT